MAQLTGRRGNAWRLRIGAAAVAAAVMAAGCSSSGGDENDATAGTAASNDETTTTAEATDETTAETSPLESTGSEDAGEALEPNASLEDVLRIVEDVHGPTDNVSGQVNRVAAYPQINGPSGAYITELHAAPALAFGDEGDFELFVTVDYVAEGTSDDLLLFYETQLPPIGWELDETSFDSDVNGNPYTELAFVLRDDDGGLQEFFEVQVVDVAEPPQTLVKTSYNYPTKPESTNFDRLTGWFDPTLVPDGGELNASRVTTTRGEGRTEIRLGTEFDYSGITQDELIQEVDTLAAATGLEQLDSSGQNSVRLIIEPFETLAVEAQEFSDHTGLKIEGTTKFENADPNAEPGAGEGAEEAPEKSTDPVPDNATAEEIEAIVDEIHGPTADISAQMNRLGPFPELPTPDGAVVTSLTSYVDLSPEGDSVATQGSVQFDVAGTLDDTKLFFETQVAAQGWTVASESTETNDDETMTTEIILYDVPGEDREFRLHIVDSVDRADVYVLWDHTTELSPAEAPTQRWLAWQEGSPMPEGQPTRLGVSTNALTTIGSATPVFFVARYSYPDIDQAELTAQIEGNVAGSDYSLGEGPNADRVYLEHSYFESASVVFFDLDDRIEAELSAVRPLTE